MAVAVAGNNPMKSNERVKYVNVHQPSSFAGIHYSVDSLCSPNCLPLLSAHLAMGLVGGCNPYRNHMYVGDVYTTAARVY
eukprot:6203584-Pleurochrysis_carterae.AAC.3